MTTEPTPLVTVLPCDEVLRGFVDDLTNGGRNPDNMLSIDHDRLRGRVKAAIRSLSKTADDVGQESAGDKLNSLDPFEVMQSFYLSPFYDPKAERPADTVQAAIAFVKNELLTASNKGGRDGE